MSTINFDRVRNVLDECRDLMNSLDGMELDESNALVSQSKGAARQRKAKASQDLQMLATRFELAASLVRVEYWIARGELDPLVPHDD